MTLLDRIRALLQADGVPSQDGREEICFLTKCQNLSVTMRIRLGPDLVLVFAQVPIFAPVYRRPALCEAITRANYGLYLGNFEMDLADGELRFKCSLPVNDAEPSDSQIRRLISTSIGVVAHYGPALLDVACTELEPATAIEKADANLGRAAPQPQHSKSIERGSHVDTQYLGTKRESRVNCQQRR